MKLPIDKKKVHTSIMILCFVYGGISLVIFIFQLYMLIRTGQFYQSQIPSNIADNLFRNGFWGSHRRLLFYPIVIVSFLGSIIAILAGLSLMDLLKKKEAKELAKNIVDSMILPNEKLIIAELENHGGELTQSELVKNTGLSKVNIHRIVKRLESLNMVNKLSYGMTNKIKLIKKD